MSGAQRRQRNEESGKQVCAVAATRCFQHLLKKNTCKSCLEEGGPIHEVTMRQPVFNGRDFVENFNDEYKRIFKVLPGCLRFDDDNEDDEEECVYEKEDDEESLIEMCLLAVHVEEDEDEDDEG